MNKSKISLILVYAIFIFAGGMLLTSCDKTELVDSNEDGLVKNTEVVELKTAEETISLQMQVSNNMLAFKTVEDYEKALDYLTKVENDDFKGWDNKFAFTSMRADCKAKKMDVEEMPITDNVLASVINTNAAIEIQGKIFVLLPKTEQVLVYDNHKNYTSKTKARTYTFDDEVITEEFGSEIEKEELAQMIESDCDCKGTDGKGRFCKHYNIGWKTWYANCSSGYWSKRTFVYKKSGIYNTLKCNIRKRSYGKQIRLTVEMKGSWTNYNGSGTFDEYKEGYGHSYTIRPYYGVRGLKDYSVDSWFRMIDETCAPWQYESEGWDWSCKK